MRKIKIFLLLCLCVLVLIPSNKVKAEGQNNIIFKTKEQAVKDGDTQIIYTNWIKNVYIGYRDEKVYRYKEEIVAFLNENNFKNISINDLDSISYDTNIVKRVNKKLHKNDYFEFIDSGITYIDYKIKKTDNYDSFIVRERCLIYPNVDSRGYFPQNLKNKKGKKIKNTFLTGGFMTGNRYAGPTTKGVIEISDNINFTHIIKKWTLNYKQINKISPKKIKNLKKAGFKKNKIYYVRYYTYKKINNNLTLYSEDCSINDFKINNKWMIKRAFKKDKNYEKYEDDWKKQNAWDLMKKAGLEDPYY